MLCVGPKALIFLFRTTHTRLETKKRSSHRAPKRIPDLCFDWVALVLTQVHFATKSAVMVFLVILFTS